MKIKKIIFVTLIAAICILGFALAGCSAPPVPPDTPIELSVDNEILTWSKMNNAIGYTVSVDENEYTCETNSFDLFDAVTTYGSHQIKVKALGANGAGNSEWSETFNYLVSDNILTYISVAPNNDGKTCSIFVKNENKSKLKGKLIIPEKVKYPAQKIIELTVTATYHKLGLSAIGFEDCVNITSVYLPDTIKKADLQFDRCTSMRRIRIPDGLTTFVGLNGCTALTKLEIPASVKEISAAAFADCDSLSELTVAKDNHYLFMDGNCILQNDNDVVTLVAGYGKSVIPGYVNTIGSSAFSGCNNITTIKIPNTVTSIGSAAFDGCKSLEEIVIPYGVTTIESKTFAHCVSLRSVTIPDSISAIKRIAFSGDTSLKAIALHDNIKEINFGAFAECTSLTEFTVPKNALIFDIGALKGCSSLKSIHIPASVKYLKDNMFATYLSLYGCPALESITVDPDNTVYYSEGNCIMARSDRTTLLLGCKTSVIPDYITTINNYAFEGMGLTHIDIPKNVTEIGDNAFAFNNFTELSIPNNIQRINYSAFACCEELTRLYISDSVTEIQSRAFEQTNTKLYGVTIPESVTNLSSPKNTIYSSYCGVFGRTTTDPFGIGDKGVTLYVPYICNNYNSADENTFPKEFHFDRNSSIFMGCDLKYESGIPYVYSYTHITEPNKLATLSQQPEINELSIYNGIETTNPELQFDWALNPRVPIRKGYTFLGWTTQKDGTEPEYKTYVSESGFTCALSYKERCGIPSGTVLYAVWAKD